MSALLEEGSLTRDVRPDSKIEQRSFVTLERRLGQLTRVCRRGHREDEAAISAHSIYSINIATFKRYE
jgi:hypothetical protein